MLGQNLFLLVVFIIFYFPIQPTILPELFFPLLRASPVSIWDVL